MVRPRQLSDEDILKTARKSFLAHGPAVSCATIAKAVGLAEATLFKRFKTKSEMLRRSLLSGMEPQWFHLVKNEPDERDPREQILEFALEINAFLERLVPALWMLQSSGMKPEDIFGRGETPPPAQAIKLLSTWFSALHRQGRACVPHPDITALSFLGSLHANNFFRHMIHEDLIAIKREDYVHGAVDLLWASIQPKQTPQEEESD